MMPTWAWFLVGVAIGLVAGWMLAHRIIEKGMQDLLESGRLYMVLDDVETGERKT